MTSSPRQSLEDAIRQIVNDYTHEAGVRELERQIGAICRAVAAKCARGVMTLAFNYGGRAEIVDAVRRIVGERLAPDSVDEAAIASRLYAPDHPDPDLLIRTGGELRVSNFLLWEVAYAEMWATPVLWPDFSVSDLDDALGSYAKRERRFGR